MGTEESMRLNHCYNEECLKTIGRMADNSIDVVVTSPPYNKRKVSGKLVKEVKYDCVSDCIPEDEYQEQQIELLNQLHRVAKSVFYNHKVRYDKFAIHPMSWILKTKWKLHQEIIWNRKITGNIRGWRLWNIDERIYWLVKDKPAELAQEQAQYTSVWDIRPEMNKIGHPAPFPEEIARRCILIGSNTGGVVYDPYMGSGTTAKVAKDTGRQWIGSEISPFYCEIIENRV